MKIYRYKHNTHIIKKRVKEKYIVMLIRPKLPIAQKLDWEVDKLTFCFCFDFN